jgi:hypothetical protein
MEGIGERSGGGGEGKKEVDRLGTILKELNVMEDGQNRRKERKDSEGREEGKHIGRKEEIKVVEEGRNRGRTEGIVEGPKE